MHLLVVLCLCGMVACGYKARLANTGENLPFDSLAVPMVKSTATIPGLEAEITNVIRNEFISHSQVAIVPYEQARAVLLGTVFLVETKPLSYDVEKSTVNGKEISSKTTRLRRLKIRMHVKLIDKKTGQVLWEEKRMEEKGSFEVGADPLAIQYNRQAAINGIAKSLARKIYLRTVETF